MSPRPAVDVISTNVKGACRIENDGLHLSRYVLITEQGIAASCMSPEVLSTWAFSQGAETVRHSYLETKSATQDSKPITHG